MTGYDKTDTHIHTHTTKIWGINGLDFLPHKKAVSLPL